MPSPGEENELTWFRSTPTCQSLDLIPGPAVTRWDVQEKIDLVEPLTRHHNGVWGDLDDGDKQAKEAALRKGPNPV